ncbi:PREDICTED: uncharacterized protein LOC105451038 [Wasmannia auropunctata]|uniref:uncharacterized protein LOC105451038 n=1 Tax=Wasmannia auropunctata TaxID=64793 RepID=UPI0005EF8D6A|nr:PREDICTED: uncharacterized protein LOC105451038 [Wasmannia auropunctata]
MTSVDGATADDSSDAEADVTIVREEKLVCTYKSGEKNVPQCTAQITPKKRKFEGDEHESPGKRRNVDVKTPRRKYNSPGRSPRSPKLSGYYSPLHITVTSPKSNRSPVRQCESPKRNQYASTDDGPSTSTTPKHKTHPLRVSLLREKFLNSDLENDGTDNNTNNETDTAVKADKTTTICESLQDPEERMENNENLLIKTNKEVRKRLSFLEEEDAFAKLSHNISQSERSLIALGHSSDQGHVDATTLVPGDENSNDSVPNSVQKGVLTMHLPKETTRQTYGTWRKSPRNFITTTSFPKPISTKTRRMRAT